jgi:hypothetical protein
MLSPSIAVIIILRRLKSHHLSIPSRVHSMQLFGVICVIENAGKIRFVGHSAPLESVHTSVYIARDYHGNQHEKIDTTATILQRQRNRAKIATPSEQHNGFLSTQRTSTNASRRPRPNPSLGTSVGTQGFPILAQGMKKKSFPCTIQKTLILTRKTLHGLYNIDPKNMTCL